jgi:type I restriction enzyme, S subunit
MSYYSIDTLFNYEKGTLQSSKCVPGSFNFITAAEEWKTHDTFTHEQEALVFAAAASGSLGRTHYINGKFSASDLCFILTPKDPVNLPVDLRFYHIIFNRLKGDIVKNTKAGTSKEAIGLKSFGSYKLPYFNFDKQVQIKDWFQKVQDSSNKLEGRFINQLDLLTKLRQQILQDAIQGKLVPQDPNDEPASVLLERIKAEKELLIKEKKLKKEKPLPSIKPEEIPFEIPENWVWCRLGDICTKITDGFHNTPTKLSTGRIYISATHIKDIGINWKECLFVSEKDHNELFKKSKPQKGEILITNRGAGCGTPAIIDINEEFSFQNAALIGFDQTRIYNKYLYYFILKSRDKIMESFVNGGLQPMLSNINLRSIPIPIPSLAEQYLIVSKVEQLMKVCDDLEQTIKKNQNYTQQLLQVALKEALEPRQDNL